MSRGSKGRAVGKVECESLTLEVNYQFDANNVKKTKIPDGERKRKEKSGRVR
jgi:hypothetical protein